MQLDLPTLIAQLSQSGAYPRQVVDVQVRQTHISVVFLVGDHVYKLKKPVKLDFLDFSTIELRKHYCDEEVRLNRRLAPDVYLGVVPVVFARGSARFEASGKPIDWAVKMRRLPESASLECRLEQGEIDEAHIKALADRLAQFHADADTSTHIAASGRFEVVARNMRENFNIAAAHVGQTVSQAVFDHLRMATEAALAELQSLIDARAARRMPRDTHGDLRLDHVYLFPERARPHDIVAIDCIEFNERFRHADPVSDMAFLAMDLQFHGHWDLARSFADAYFAASGDVEGRRLLPLYLAYRAAVRGKVDSLQLDAPEIPLADRDRARDRGRGHWLLALGELAPPGKRPCLVLVGGLPGTGKSTLAARLSQQAGLQVIRSDVVRKELAGLNPETSAATAPGCGLYTPEWTDRTYAECLRRAETLLFSGKRVLVDATFIEESRRCDFLDAAVRWGVPGVFFVCEAGAETVKARLAARHGDASDADWGVYERAARAWQNPSAATLRRQHVLNSDSGRDPLCEAARCLREHGLHE